MKGLRLEQWRTIPRQSLMPFVLVLCLFAALALQARTGAYTEDPEEGRIAVLKSLHQGRAQDSKEWILLRREDIEQDVYFFQLQSQARLKGDEALPFRVRRVRVFDVKRSGILMQGELIVGHIVELHPTLVDRYLYDPATKNVYHVTANDRSMSGVNDFVSTLALIVDTQEKALDVFNLWSILTHPSEGGAIVKDELDLMGVTIVDVRNRLGTKTGGAFDAYWKKCPLIERRKVQWPSAARKGNGFAVTFFVYDRGELRRTTVNISQTGRIALQQSDRLCQFRLM